MLKPTLQTSRLLPVALVSLGLLLASPAGAASMTESERCNWKLDKVENRYSKCLSRSTTRLSNRLDGSTLDEDFHCAEQFHRSMDVIERRATFKEVGPECEARLTPESQACTQAAALIVAGRDLGDYGSQFDDLSLEDLSCSPIQAYLQDSYDDGYDAGYDTGYDDGEASVDVASNDQSVCEAADGTWENGSCTPVVNCFIGGICKSIANHIPPGLTGVNDFQYTNVYVVPETGILPARFAACADESGYGKDAWREGSIYGVYQLPPYRNMSVPECQDNNRICSGQVSLIWPYNPCAGIHPIPHFSEPGY